MLRFTSSKTSSIIIRPSSTSSSSSVFRGAGLLSCTPLLRFGYEKLDDFYRQEAFESLQRFNESKTYPGNIKAATPGDTTNHMNRHNTVLEHTSDRHYWRAVVDDPEPRRYVTVAVRFKEDVSVGDRFETHQNVVLASVPDDCNIGHLMQSVVEMNDSPYLCVNPFSLVLDGKTLHPDQSLTDAGVSESTVLEAVDDVVDHRLNEEGYKSLNWFADEMTSEVENRAPYAEMKLTENLWKAKRSPNSYRYSGTKPASSTTSQYGIPYGVQGHRM